MGAIDGLQEVETNRAHPVIKAGLAALFTGKMTEESY